MVNMFQLGIKRCMLHFNVMLLKWTFIEIVFLYYQEIFIQEVK